jgi:outer membrane receptor protein involved in Fe transport
MWPGLRVCIAFLLIASGGSTFLRAQGLLRGSVRSEASGETLAGAQVRVASQRLGTYSDEDGNFSLRLPLQPPITLIISYLGYDSARVEVSSYDKPLVVSLAESSVSLDAVEIVTTTLAERQRQSPLTVESMSISAIRETPAANFYDGLGNLKGVDLTAASIGFKVINTRGFNAAAPIRSLQIIDGVDNQAPGLNFSLGNFLGASELDVEQVDLVVGASSAYYGPNAFNGVISMKTKDPFIHKGLSAMVRLGERNMGEFAVRYAHMFKNKAGAEKFAIKFNTYFLTVDDWEADNLDPVFGANEGPSNPGGYDAVNRYGDENLSGGINNATTLNDRALNPGLGRWYRTGYREVDLVDYYTYNFKAALAMHYKIRPQVDLIAASNFATGSTVMQGDNRYRLEDILFFQNRVEIRKPNTWFLRAYATHEDAGNSYDAVFTAFRLQDEVKSNNTWSTDYRNYWGGLSPSNPFYVPPRNGRGGMRGRVQALEGFPPQTFPYDYARADAIMAANMDSLFAWHALARYFADNFQFDRLDPDSAEFRPAFERITSTPLSRGGTRLVDRSALYHVHGEHKFRPEWMEITLGGEGRLYTPVSEGNIFSDTLSYVWETLPSGERVKVDSSFNRITNYQFGAYVGAERKLWEDRIKLNATLRVDKNQNFAFVPTYAVSAVYLPSQQHTFRAGLSSAVRNPTLTDQYLYYNVGRAILLGNINGVQGLADTASLRRYFDSSPKDADLVEYFDVAPIKPEQVRTLELGYRGMLARGRFYIDAGYYFSRYRDFLGFNIGVDVRFSSILPDQLVSAQAYRVAANAQDIVTTQGASLGLNYFFEKGYTLSGNYSWNILNTQSDDPIIPAFNTPEHKFNLSFSGRDIELLGIKHLGFNVNYKWVQGYLFEGSPQFTGTIPTYDMIDAQVNKYVPKLKSTFKLGASNLLNNQVYLLYGGPRIGRLAYFTVTTDLNRL